MAHVKCWVLTVMCHIYIHYKPNHLQIITFKFNSERSPMELQTVTMQTSPGCQVLSVHVLSAGQHDVTVQGSKVIVLSQPIPLTQTRHVTMAWHAVWLPQGRADFWPVVEVTQIPRIHLGSYCLLISIQITTTWGMNVFVSIYIYCLFVVACSVLWCLFDISWWKSLFDQNSVKWKLQGAISTVWLCCLNCVVSKPAIIQLQFNSC